MKRAFQVALAVFVALLGIGVYQYWGLILVLSQQTQMFLPPSLDEGAEAITESLVSPAILSFSKTNGFRHHEAIEANRKLLDELGAEHGWDIYHTENGAVFTPDNLRKFDLVMLSHKSGTTWTDPQRQALRDYVESGGTVIATHAAGDASNHEWEWYRHEVIRADFIGHPMVQHLQSADLIVENTDHPVTRDLPETWTRVDEWYGFAESPRDETNVLIRIDESSYDPEDYGMGGDHPMVWWHETGSGRILYNALGHTGESYQEPLFRQLVENAIRWGLNTQ